MWNTTGECGITSMKGGSMSKLIRLVAVEDMTGLKKSAIYNKIKEGDFPTAVHLGTRHVAWMFDEVQAWIDSRPRVEYEKA